MAENLIEGQHVETSVDDLRNRKPIPISLFRYRLIETLTHMVWYLPSVNSCYAMKHLLAKEDRTPSMRILKLL